MTNKGWSFLGDSYNGECQSILSTNEDFLTNDINIYPSPATDFIKVKNVKLSESFIIFDASARIVLQGKLNSSEIDVRTLEKGNYILQILSKNKTENFKFIKK